MEGAACWRQSWYAAAVDEVLDTLATSEEATAAEEWERLAAAREMVAAAEEAVASGDMARANQALRDAIEHTNLLPPIAYASAAAALAAAATSDSDSDSDSWRQHAVWQAVTAANVTALLLYPSQSPLNHPVCASA